MREGEGETHAIKLQQEKRGKEGGGRKMERGGRGGGSREWEGANGIKLIGYKLFRNSSALRENKTLDRKLHICPVCHNLIVHRVPQLACPLS